MASPVVKAINACGRFLEFVLTGQSSYALTTSSFCTADTIHNTVQAKMAQKEVVAFLQARFGMVLQHLVIVILDKPQSTWKRVIPGSGQHLGNHMVRQMGEKNAHEIRLVPGLERRKFKAVLAHELTHAFQAERQILCSHRGLKEGMARWVEYHILCEMKLDKEAKKLCQYRSFVLGRNMLAILERERQHGMAATMDWLEHLR